MAIFLTVQDPVQVAGLHLPHVDRAVAAADHHEVVSRSPFDAHHGEQVAGGEGHAFPLRQTCAKKN